MADNRALLVSQNLRPEAHIVKDAHHLSSSRSASLAHLHGACVPASVLGTLRALHSPIPDDLSFCKACTTSWPCATRLVIDEANNPLDANGRSDRMPDQVGTVKINTKAKD
jgi:hypothetical protein